MVYDYKSVISTLTVYYYKSKIRMNVHKTSQSSNFQSMLSQKYLICGQIPEYIELSKYVNDCQHKEDLSLNPLDSTQKQQIHTLIDNLLDILETENIKDPIPAYRLVSYSLSLISDSLGKSSNNSTGSTYSYSQRSSITTDTYDKNDAYNTIKSLIRRIKVLEIKNDKFKTDNQNLRNQILEFQNKSNNKVGSIRADMVGLTGQHSELARNHQKVLKKLSKYAQQNSDLKVRFEQLQSEYAFLDAENSKNILVIEKLQNEAKKSMTSSKSVPSNGEHCQYDKLMKMFDNLVGQFKDQSDEITQISNSRAELITVVHRLNDLNQRLDEMFTKVRTENDDLRRQCEAIPPPKEVTVPEQCSAPTALPINNFDSIIHSVVQHIEKSMPSVRDILNNSMRHISERLVEAINQAYKEGGKRYIDENEHLRELVRRLNAEVCSELRFIDQIASSKSIQSWFVRDEDPNEVRNALIEEAARVNAFLTENALGLVQETTLFDSMIVDSTLSNDFHIKLKEFLNSFNGPSNETEQQLYIVLLQSLTANEILRRYSTEARRQCLRQAEDIRALKSDVIRSQDDFQMQLDQVKTVCYQQVDEHKKQREIAEKALQKARSILRTSACKSEAVLDALNDMNAAASEFNENEYIANIESQLTTAKAQLEEMSNDIKLKENQLANITEVYESKYREVEERYSKQNSTLLEQKENAEALAQLNEKALSASRQENDILRKEIEKVKRQLDDEQQISRSKIKELSNEAELLKVQHKQEVETIHTNYENIIIEAEEAKIAAKDQILQMRALLKKKIAKREAQYATATEKTTEALRIADQEVIKLRATCVTHQTNEAAAKAAFEEKSQELEKIKTELNELQAEQRLLHARLASSDEKLKREKAVQESQLKAKLLSVKTDAKSQLEKQRADYNAKYTQMLHDISELFEGYIDDAEDVNDKYIISVLTRVSQDYNQFKEDAAELLKANFKLGELTSIFGWSESDNLVEYARSLVDKLKIVSKENQRLTTQVAEMKKETIEARSIIQQNGANKEWENWARKLHVLVSDGFNVARSSSQIRRSLEEVIFTAIGKRLIWRRLDSLRTQKRLLINGFLGVQTSSKPLSLTHLLSICVSVRRMQRLSGNISSPLGLSKFDRETFPDQVESHTPLFENFVLTTL